jgi:uncharacterized protein YecE (DUF72 family)
MTEPVRIGTAGWSIASRYRDEFAEAGSHLERYAQRLDSVEINSSFYKPHRLKTWQRWADSTPAGFRFSVKLPKAISHEAQLVGCDALLDRFLADVAGLGDRLGVLLLQLPPKLVWDAGVFDVFVEELQARSDVPVALEPRHASWFTAEADAQLIDLRIPRVAADPAKIPGADEPGGWRGLAYYRWHGTPRVYYSDYDAGALHALHEQLAERRRQAVPTWCIFDNTASGAALGNALTLAGR